jgi:outer membrane usher protein
LALAYAQQRYLGQPDLRTLSVSQNLVLRERAAVNLTISHGYGAQSGTSGYLGFTLALAPRRSVAMQATAANSTGAPPAEIYATAQQNSPAGPGFGYRLGMGTHGSYDAAWRAQTGVGDLELQGVRNQGAAAQSALWSGAATLLGGSLRATRVVNGSFALVDVGGIAGVPVYVDHQLITHTDRHGLALLHDLRAFEANRINVEPLELPLDTRIGARTVVLAPAWRSGVIARFPVVRERGATFRLLQGDDRVVPAGAAFEAAGQSLVVALDGVGYLPRYEGATSGVAHWGDTRCEFRLPGIGSNDPLPDLGIIRCTAAPG